MTNFVTNQDLVTLIGLLAVYEAELMIDYEPRLAERVASKFAASGLIETQSDIVGLRHAIGDLNQRLRTVLGEFE